MPKPEQLGAAKVQVVARCAEHTRVMPRDAGIQIAEWEAGCVWAPGISPEQQSRVCPHGILARAPAMYRFGAHARSTRHLVSAATP